MSVFDQQRAPSGGIMQNWGVVNPAGYIPPTPQAGLLYAPPVATGEDLTRPLAGVGARLGQQGFLSNFANGLRRFVPGMGQGPMDPNGQTGIGAPGSTPNTSGLGFNIDTAQLGLSALNTVGGLWAAFKQLGLSEDMFKTQTRFANTNLANSIQNYNTALSDTANARGHTQGDSRQTIDEYIKSNQLPTPKKG